MSNRLHSIPIIVIALVGPLSAQSLPHVQADTLSSNKIALPDAALGHPAIFIIGFSRAAGDSTGRWGKELKKQFANDPDLRFYSVAVLQDAPKMVRGMIRHGMRGGIPKEEQDRFVLIYEGEDAWKSFAGFSEPDDAYIVLVDAKGTPLARVHGKAADEKSLGILKDALARNSSTAQSMENALSYPRGEGASRNSR
jgi:hypothetical protein